MKGTIPWPRALGGKSPFWRPAGHRDRTAIRRSTAVALLVLAAVWSVLYPSVNGVGPTILGYVLLFSAPLWLVISVLSSAASIGSWSPRVNLSLLWLGLVVIPTGLAIAFNGPIVDVVLMGVALGAAAAWVSRHASSRGS